MCIFKPKTQGFVHLLFPRVSKEYFRARPSEFISIHKLARFSSTGAAGGHMFLKTCPFHSGF